MIKVIIGTTMIGATLVAGVLSDMGIKKSEVMKDHLTYVKTKVEKKQLVADSKPLPVKIVYKTKIVYKDVIKTKIVYKDVIKTKIVYKATSGVNHNRKIGVTDTDTAIVKRGGSKAWRNNNPGNISCMNGRRYGAIGIAHTTSGDKGDQRMCVFSSLDSGWSAMDNMLRVAYGKGPIKKTFRKYQTDMRSFRNKIKSLTKLGINVNKSYNSLSWKQRRKFQKEWARHEGFITGRIEVLSKGRPCLKG